MNSYIKLDTITNIIVQNIINNRKTSVADLVDIQTIDIVHCGECKYCRDELIEEYMPLYIYCEKWNHETSFNNFCSTGERINNE